MSERIRETLSALMDDEATELEIRRLLMHEDQAGVQSTWYRYQQTRAVLREDEQAWAGVDLLEGINEALDAESETAAMADTPMPVREDEPTRQAVPEPLSGTRPAARTRPARRWWSLGAAAAAVLVAAVWVVRPDTGGAPANQVAALGAPHEAALKAHLMKHMQYAAMNTGQLVAYARLNALDVQGE